MRHDSQSHPHPHEPQRHAPGAPDPAKQESLRREAPLAHALRMGNRIVGWALVLGFVLSALFAVSTPGTIDWTGLIARGLIIGIALAAAIIIVALMLPGVLPRK